MIERAAADAHAAWCRQHGHRPIPWERLRPRDRARWLEIADAVVATWTLGIAAVRLRTEQQDP